MNFCCHILLLIVYCRDLFAYERPMDSSQNINDIPKSLTPLLIALIVFTFLYGIACGAMLYYRRNIFPLNGREISFVIFLVVRWTCFWYSVQVHLVLGSPKALVTKDPLGPAPKASILRRIQGPRNAFSYRVPPSSFRFYGTGRLSGRDEPITYQNTRAFAKGKHLSRGLF